MKCVYDKLYENNDWQEYQHTRKQQHMFIRHLVRYFFYTTTKHTLKEVAQIEAHLLNRDPVSHDTIINSIQQSKLLKKTRLYKKVGQTVMECEQVSSRWQRIYSVYSTLPIHKQLSIMQDLLQSHPGVQSFIEMHPDFNNEPEN